MVFNWLGNCISLGVNKKSYYPLTSPYCH
jgi:hypothetical protein